MWRPSKWRNCSNTEFWGNNTDYYYNLNFAQTFMWKPLPPKCLDWIDVAKTNLRNFPQDLSFSLSYPSIHLTLYSTSPNLKHCKTLFNVQDTWISQRSLVLSMKLVMLVIKIRIIIVKVIITASIWGNVFVPRIYWLY